MDPKDEAMMKMCDQMISMIEKMKSMMSGEDQAEGNSFDEALAGKDEMMNKNMM